MKELFDETLQEGLEDEMDAHLGYQKHDIQNISRQRIAVKARTFLEHATMGANHPKKNNMNEQPPNEVQLFDWD
nr:hypothetical protein [Paenibacillus glacialis]